MVPGSTPISPIKRPFRPANPIRPDYPKKTRDLPNLSDCHSCGRHVTSSTTPLQPLPSLWRIVLLCNPCLIRVRSAESCSYCLSPSTATSEDSCRCGVCRCRLHIDCVVRYRSSPPWSLCTDLDPTQLGSTVCIDCWVPKSLAVPDRVCRKRRPEGGEVSERENRCLESEAKGAKARDLLGKRVVRVSSDGGREKNKIVRDGRGKEKVVVRNSALEILDGKMKSAKNKREGERNELSMKSSSKGSGVDDAELAIRLHRAMNSSPRISRKFLLGSSSGLNASVVKVDNGDLSVMRPKGRFDISYKRRGSDNVDSICSGYSFSVASSEEGNSKRDFLVYRRKSKECDDCLVKNEVTRDDEMTLENQKGHLQDLLVYKRKFKTFDECQVRQEVISEKSMILENRNCHMQGVLVYKRKFKKDEIQEISEGVPENSMYLENQSCGTNDKLDNTLSVDSEKNQSHFECNGICNVKMENPDRTC